MGILTDNLAEEEKQEFYDGIRATIQKAVSGIGASARSAQNALSQFADAVKECEPLVDEFLFESAKILGYQPEGQHHLELDESTLKSTGKSVSVDDVIAKIDELTDS